MQLTPAKRDKLADQLTWLANRNSLGLPEDRRHERVAPRDRYTTARLANGREFAARLIDISMSGAAVIVDYRPPIGSPVVLGSTASPVPTRPGHPSAAAFLPVSPPLPP